MLHEINLRSSKRDEMIDITGQVQRIVSQVAVLEGLAVVYAAHTIAGITINENADPDVTRDLLRRLDEIVPWDMAADFQNLRLIAGMGNVTRPGGNVIKYIRLN